MSDSYMPLFLASIAMLAWIHFVCGIRYMILQMIGVVVLGCMVLCGAYWLAAIHNIFEYGYLHDATTGGLFKSALAGFALAPVLYFICAISSKYERNPIH